MREETPGSSSQGDPEEATLAPSDEEEPKAAANNEIDLDALMNDAFAELESTKVAPPPVDAKPSQQVKPPTKLTFKNAKCGLKPLNTTLGTVTSPVTPGTPGESEPWTPTTPLVASPKRKSTMNDFKLLTVLGRGSYGKVVKARRKQNAKIVAIKTMHKEELKEAEVLDWVEQEKKVIQKIEKHPHVFVTKIEETFRTKALIVYVMEFLPGGDLGFHLRKVKDKLFPLKRAKFYFAELCLAINHLHSHSIIYRDVKPENIILDADGHCVLADFGFAKLVPPKERTMTAFCGSEEFLAPEMINGDQKPYSFEVDWWSAAVTFYNLLTGHVPWSDDVPRRTYEKICEANLPRRKLEDPEYHFLRQMLNPKIEERLKNFEDIKHHPFMDDLDWAKLEARELEPPFVPDLLGDDCKYFSPEFTSMSTQLSIVHKEAASPKTPLSNPKTPKTPKSPNTPKTGGKGKKGKR